MRFILRKNYYEDVIVVEAVPHSHRYDFDFSIAKHEAIEIPARCIRNLYPGKNWSEWEQRRWTFPLPIGLEL